MRKKNTKKVIGKDDRVDFPQFNLSDIRVKIDSGAYTSTIDCSLVEETENGLCVVFLDKKELGFTGEKFLFQHYTKKKVRSSSGTSQLRYKIIGDIILFGRKYNTEFTLSSRTKMRYPVLLGRKLLNKRFLIDTSLSDQSWNDKNNSSL